MKSFADNEPSKNVIKRRLMRPTQRKTFPRKPRAHPVVMNFHQLAARDRALNGNHERSRRRVAQHRR
jgi:hypothetical protein